MDAIKLVLPPIPPGDYFAAVPEKPSVLLRLRRAVAAFLDETPPEPPIKRIFEAAMAGDAKAEARCLELMQYAWPRMKG